MAGRTLFRLRKAAVCGLVLCFADLMTRAEDLGEIDVVLIGGQSNATGQGMMANLPSGYALPEGALMFHSALLKSGKEPNQWHALVQASESPDRFGPELGFAETWTTLHPERKLAFIKHAISGSNLYQQWKPDPKQPGPYLKTFLQTAQAGLAGLEKQGYRPRVRAMLWQQGESDANVEGAGSPADHYDENLKALVAIVRNQLNAPEMIFVYGLVLPRAEARFLGRDMVRQAQRDCDEDSGSPSAIFGALAVGGDDLSLRKDDPHTRYPEDTIHFGTAGMLELGRRFARRLDEGLKVPRFRAQRVHPIPAFRRAELELKPFYKKMYSIHGMAIVASGRVRDEALLETAYLMHQTLGPRPEIFAAINAAKTKMTVMAYDERTTDVPEHAHLKPKSYWDRRARGLGANRESRTTSCAEENMLCFKGDPYFEENIMIHEFAHTVQDIAMTTLEPGFDEKIQAAFKAARAEGKWGAPSYAGTNFREYWSEAVQSWFNNNRENDNQHNEINTRAELKAYDPAIAALVQEVYSNAPWTYTRPWDRPPEARAHLQFLNREELPPFQWAEK